MMVQTVVKIAGALFYKIKKYKYVINKRILYKLNVIAEGSIRDQYLSCAIERTLFLSVFVWW